MIIRLIKTFLKAECNVLSTIRLKSTTSSNMWLKRQQKDPYVRRAIKESYRARSAFKLIEIDQKYKFLKPGDFVIDVGASPGSWCQVCVQKTNSDSRDASKPKGMVIGIDREYIMPIEGATLLSYSDITDEKTFENVAKLVNDRKVDAVISDMAPNSTGQSTFDHDNIIMLQKKAFQLAKRFLVDKGYFVCKIWFGDSTKEFMHNLESYFELVKLVKPDASRSDSAEIFIFCSNFSNEKCK